MNKVFRLRSCATLDTNLVGVWDLSFFLQFVGSVLCSSKNLTSLAPSRAASLLRLLRSSSHFTPRLGFRGRIFTPTQRIHLSQPLFSVMLFSIGTIVEMSFPLDRFPLKLSLVRVGSLTLQLGLRAIRRRMLIF